MSMTTFQEVRVRSHQNLTSFHGKKTLQMIRVLSHLFKSWLCSTTLYMKIQFRSKLPHNFRIPFFYLQQELDMTIYFLLPVFYYHQFSAITQQKHITSFQEKNYISHCSR